MTSCDESQTPGFASGLVAQAMSPTGVIMLNMRGVSNSACVRSWDIAVRGEGQAGSTTVNVNDPVTGAATLRFTGRANGRYTFTATAISPSGRRGMASTIGPVLADGRTVLAASPR